MKKTLAMAAFLAALSCGGVAWAGNGYILSIQNDTKDALEMTVTDSRDWQPKHLVTGQKVVPNSIESFYTEDDQDIRSLPGKIWRTAWSKNAAHIDLTLYSFDKKSKHKVSLYHVDGGYGGRAGIECDGKRVVKGVAFEQGGGPTQQTPFSIRMTADGKLTCK